MPLFLRCSALLLWVIPTYVKVFRRPKWEIHIVLFFLSFRDICSPRADFFIFPRQVPGQSSSQFTDCEERKGIYCSPKHALWEGERWLLAVSLSINRMPNCISSAPKRLWSFSQILFIHALYIIRCRGSFIVSKC